MWASSFVVENKTAAMEASALQALVYDPLRCSKLSMEQKRELVYEMAKWPDGVSEMLQAWSRQEILQILCAELGKERKYTGLTKSKIIENLLKIIYEKKSLESTTVNISDEQPPPENGERNHKRQRKSDHPNRLFIASNGSAAVLPDFDLGKSTVYCKNSACKAKLNQGDVFCKRCSCCICRQYDDNKDPSLWLICNSDPPFCGVSCGMSCHLECALRHENSGISQDKGLDGSFCCVSCGKVNDLLSSWRKQLSVARDTRRVDILCYRLSLSQKILAGTERYQNVCEIVDEAVKKLEEDVGPLTGLPVKKARGIVNRLDSGPEIQRLCASALESLDLLLSKRVSDMPSGCNALDSKLVRFEDIRASSLIIYLKCDDLNTGTIGYSLWHRKADDTDYPAEPTHRLLKPNTKFLLSGLTPLTQYFLKVVSLDAYREMVFAEFQFQTGSPRDEFPNMTSKIMELERSLSPATNCSSLSNPSSIEDETNNVLTNDKNRGDNYLPFFQNAEKTASDQSLKEVTTLVDDDALLKESSNAHTCEETSKGNGSNTPRLTGLECVPYVNSLSITPCKFENTKDDSLRCNRPKFCGKDIVSGSKRDEEPQAGSSSKKRSGEMRDDKCTTGIGDKDFEYYVKVIRWLECNGHIETSFRQKLLTWYSLRATPQEVRVVKVFIDTFIEDPECLAGQLVDSFSDVVSNRRCSRVPAGFCMKLWH